MLHLDHIAVSGLSRDIGRAHVQDHLHVEMVTGGEHPFFGTHNHLMSLSDGLYLEAIAIDPAAPALDHARWFGLDHFSGPPRLTNWICQTKDLETLVRDLPEAGRIVELERGNLRWRMSVPQHGMLSYDGCFPALIEWDCADHPGRMLPETGCTLDALTIFHPEVDRLQQRLAPYLDDARVRFEHGSPHLVASIETPQGSVAFR